jgi:hypothetical protein
MFKKIFLFFLISIFSFLAVYVYGIAKVTVTFQSASLEYNNHVGNDWGYSAWINGEEIRLRKNKVFELENSGTIKIKAQAVEYDKSSDIGSSQKIIKVSSLSNELANVTLNVTVTENRGRYSGNQAQWKFIFLVKKE